MGPVLRNLKVWYMLQEQGHSHPQQGFPIHTLWHQQQFGRTTGLPVPIPLGNLGWGTVECRKHLLLHGGVNPLVLGVGAT